MVTAAALYAEDMGVRVPPGVLNKPLNNRVIYMGMFDWVKLDKEIPCPECGSLIRSDSWQTKDADCMMETIPEAFLQLNQIWRFYTNCNNSHWVEFQANVPLPHSDILVPGHPISYVMITKK